mmetsp:Transcript_2879/g.8960  ORF Transcript_2879/g.8960 Transcript_2879/m.8960 type:complete len:250 (+) Transcript_2879:606-1355(+)
MPYETRTGAMSTSVRLRSVTIAPGLSAPPYTSISVPSRPSRCSTGTSSFESVIVSASLPRIRRSSDAIHSESCDATASENQSFSHDGPSLSASVRGVASSNGTGTACFSSRHDQHAPPSRRSAHSASASTACASATTPASAASTFASTASMCASATASALWFPTATSGRRIDRAAITISGRRIDRAVGSDDAPDASGKPTRKARTAICDPRAPWQRIGRGAPGWRAATPGTQGRFLHGQRLQGHGGRAG